MPAKFNLDYEGLQPGMAGGLFSNLAACDATLPAKQKYIAREMRSICSLNYTMNRKLILISLEHNCIPATCCSDDASRGKGT